MEFVGCFCFNRQETRGWIARPFSGDVLTLGADSMQEEGRFELSSQPSILD